jgi:broad specificity phosphatase PhoE
MKLIFNVLLCSALCSACSTTIYVVRHAEKQGAATAMMSNDPDLTEAGKERANALADSLKKKKITAVYSTPYKRTQQTAEPTAILKLLQVNSYNANAGETLIDSLAGTKKKAYLVVGHSNTVPAMLRKLGLHPSMQDIPDNDYDNFFVVRIKWFFGKNITLTEKTYGKVSP